MLYTLIQSYENYIWIKTGGGGEGGLLEPPKRSSRSLGPLHYSVVVHLLSCVWLFCDPMDCSPSGSSVHGISQARILEWVAISSSRGSSWARDRTLVSSVAGRFFTVWATREAPWQLQSHIITRTRLCLYWSIFLHPLGSHPHLQNPPSPGLQFRFISQGLLVRPWTRSLGLGLYIWEMGRVIGAITNRNKWADRHLKCFASACHGACTQVLELPTNTKAIILQMSKET